MLTIFSIPKPFQGHIGIIQVNAVESWRRLRPACQIILCGDEQGTRSVATELGVDFIPNVTRNSYGTPLLDSVFDLVQGQAIHPLLCYVNADILLLSDFPDAIRKIAFPHFVMIGQRWDLDISERWDFAGPEWEARLRQRTLEAGSLHPPAGSDYFVLPRQSLPQKIPPFAVGRPGWDNWFIYQALKRRIPVVDATQGVTVIHQNHDYSHVPDHRGDFWEGPEADENRALMAGPRYTFTIADATHFLSPQKNVMPKHTGFISRVVDACRLYAFADFPTSRWFPMYRFLRKSFIWAINRVPGARTVARSISILPSRFRS